MRKMMILPAAALALGLGGCADGQLTSGGRDTLIGAGVGAGVGAAIGSFTGSAGVGALIGAGVGAAGGYLWNQHQVAERQAAERRQQQLNAAYERGYQSGRSSASRPHPQQRSSGN